MTIYTGRPATASGTTQKDSLLAMVSLDTSQTMATSMPSSTHPRTVLTKAESIHIPLRVVVGG